MPVGPRSLISNSAGSILASGMLIFSTILIPAILARALTREEFDTYSIVLAALPLMMVLPQSVRAVGASQLALAVKQYGLDESILSYWRFTFIVSAVHVSLVTVGIEIFVAVNHAHVEAALVRKGEYALLGYTLGLLAVGLVIGPAAAQRDFRFDNLAKFWPGLFQLLGISAVWSAQVSQPLPWIFAVYVASSWSIAATLMALGGGFKAARYRPSESDLVREYGRGLRGVLWWNITAYLATAVTVMLVAIGFKANIVPFGIATSLLGVVAAAPIAVSGPIAVHAAAMLDNTPAQRRRFFLLVNTLFQAYIVLSALVIVIAPAGAYALWLTPSLAGEVKTFSMLLLPATVIRLLTMNFTIFMMSAGRQHTLWLSPMVEAAMSVIGSIVFGWLFGVEGIPLALAISAVGRLLLTIVHDEPLGRGALALSRGDVLLSAWRLVKRPRC